MARNDTNGDPVDLSPDPPDASVPRTWGRKVAEPEVEETVSEETSDGPRRFGRKPSEPRKKVTSEDVEASLGRLGERVRRPRTLRVAATAASLLVAMGCLLGQSMAQQDFQATRTSNIAQIKELQEKIKKVDSSVQQAPDEEKVTGYVQGAQTAGAEVAKLQNAYLDMGKSPNGNDAAENAKKMDSWLAAGPDGKQNSARVPWVATPEDYKGASGQPQYSWVFVSATPSSDLDKIEILWQMRRTDGEMVAWAIGTYDAPSKKIGKLSYGVTKSRGSVSDVTVQQGDPQPTTGAPMETDFGVPSSAAPNPSATRAPTPGASPTASARPGQGTGTQTLPSAPAPTPTSTRS